ncbi:MAG: thioredoxin domain-containing protein [Proteobacteria bacterium]|nr:thioredoxin domain-containing protein [Pseudomonadota bacterium]
MTRNMLNLEASPYLLQHRDNPVHWGAWNNAALNEAKSQDKPILLSVGYAACHWCHVMAHESFESPEIAAVMNELFVNIKVDREERPDIDTIYQNALALTGQQGGWPLTMFLTPEGEPFWGGTYFPPEPRYGRPGFTEVLQAVSKIYREDPDKVKQNATSLVDGLRRMATNSGDHDIYLQTVDQLNAAADVVYRRTDPVHGGFGSAPKFPMISQYLLLWRGYQRTGNTDWRDAVITTLDHMCQGGIYDHLGGGFARYSTDEAWFAPHFEKMLYDNAQLLEILTLVWAETRSPLYEARVRETIEWLMREMKLEGEAFAGTLDADSEGREGAFYVWDDGEIDALLGERSAGFKNTYGVQRAGNWEGSNILNRLDALTWGDPEEEEGLAAARAILLEARARRERPGLDDKVLLDWNGMLIAALAQASILFDEPDWTAAAVSAYDFMQTEMFADGIACHSWRNGQAKGDAILDDYAQMGRAALSLLSATGNDDYLADAQLIVDLVEKQFLDTLNGGYYYTPEIAERLIARSRNGIDNATPSGNGAMSDLLARLYHLTGEAAYRERTENIVAAFTGVPPDHLAHHASIANGFEVLAAAIQIIIVGEARDPRTRMFVQTAARAGNANLVMRIFAPDVALPQSHPATGKTQIGGEVTAYLCRGSVCSAPVTDPDALSKLLSE